MTYLIQSPAGPLATFFEFEYAKDFADSIAAAKSVVRSDGVVLAKKWAANAYVPAEAAVLDALEERAA